MSTFKRLIGFLRQARRMVALAVALGWATTVSWIALISTSAYLISYAALQPSIAELQVAIVGVRFTSTEVMSNAAEIVVYGTAVRLAE